MPFKVRKNTIMVLLEECVKKIQQLNLIRFDFNDSKYNRYEDMAKYCEIFSSSNGEGERKVQWKEYRKETEYPEKGHYWSKL